jgi:C4-type Zn-finger protein
MPASLLLLPAYLFLLPASLICKVCLYSKKAVMANPTKDPAEVTTFVSYGSE